MLVNMECGVIIFSLTVSNVFEILLLLFLDRKGMISAMPTVPLTASVKHSC